MRTRLRSDRLKYPGGDNPALETVYMPLAVGSSRKHRPAVAQLEERPVKRVSASSNLASGGKERFWREARWEVATLSEALPAK